MGFWNGKVDNSYDRMFDYDRNGSLDVFERGLQMHVIDEMCKEDEENDTCSFDFDELEDMNEEERREALEEAGYDPDDFE